ncbi:heterocycloanthracin/sonorensin family bacteriocin [Paenibacillus solanacearum]|uniref:heterocycloanthracin/sonorensin family bacteriocin n=1 Tax=Paenibacillus solanacearum TaxID=2048548 RepID=UPI001C4038A9|nr:heterocycloanthracin/sonorensin family bacteriocin [Paenibacillus solanacearum]
MNEFQNELQQLSVSPMQASEMTPWSQQSPYPAWQFPAGVHPVDPSRLCVGFGGFCAGFCGGFCTGFCGGFCTGFCGGFCSSCAVLCGGIRCGAVRCGAVRCGVGPQRCR